EVATTPFDEESAISYEAGIKSTWFGNRLLVNGVGFFTDYEDLQVTRFFQPVDAAFGEFITENAGAAEIFGAELELVALLNDYIEVGGNYAYLDAEFTDFQGQPSIAADGTITDPGDFNGNTLRLAPEHTASVFLKFDYPLGNGSALSGKVKYRYQDDMFFDPDNNPINVSPAYSLVDVWAAYTTPNERFEVKAWVNNLTDEEYVTHGFTQRGSRIAFGLFGEPRSYGLTLTAKW
ncbi:MAG: TonB-dependent receptor, partial [Pseudomonadota bacterium]